MNKLAPLLLAMVLGTFPVNGHQRGLTPVPADEKKVALVIGNAAYAVSPLVNPTNDARGMSRVLREIGFEVDHRENLSQNEMRRAIRAFGDRLTGGGVGLFYYAGHGVQVGGKNYLIPTSAVIRHEYEVEFESIDVGLVLAQMENARNRLNIVILDACRDNPFARSFRSSRSGLASIDAPGGTLIAYATAPGRVADDGSSGNGLYTEALLGALEIPGLKVEDVFKRVRASVQARSGGAQVPWESSSLVGDFVFRAVAPLAWREFERSGIALRAPEGWDFLEGTVFPLSIVDNSSRERLTRAAVSFREVGPDFDLKAQTDKDITKSREQRGDFNLLSRRTGSLAGREAEFVTAEMTLPNSNHRITVLAGMVPIDGRRYFIQAQCLADEFIEKRALLNEIVESFGLAVANSGK